jgi:hypothetical protein
MRLHPRPGATELAKAACATRLAGAANMAGVCADIERNHAAWVEYWAGLPRHEFRPMLHRWFQDGDYMLKPAVQAQVAQGGVQW